MSDESQTYIPQLKSLSLTLNDVTKRNEIKKKIVKTKNKMCNTKIEIDYLTDYWNKVKLRNKL